MKIPNSFWITIIVAFICEFNLIFINNWKITCIVTPIITLLFYITEGYIIIKNI